MTGLELFFQYIVAGLTRGSIYAVIAIGFNIIYNCTGIINFAQGEFVVLGALIGITLAAFVPIPLAVLLAVVLAALYGAIIEIVFIRYQRRFSALRALCISSVIFIFLALAGLVPILSLAFNPINLLILLFLLSLSLGVGLLAELVFSNFIKEQNILRLIIITIGVSILTREAMDHVWGKEAYAFPFFSGNEVSSVALGNIQFSPQLLWILGTLLLIVSALYAFFKFSLWGKAMRATSLDRQAARLCGINTRFLITLSFIISAGMGALGGIVTSPLTQTKYDMGAHLAINGFAVAILGGLGNSFAAALAGLLLGILEALSVAFLPNAFKDIVAIFILLAVLFIRPAGIFGSQKETALKDF